MNKVENPFGHEWLERVFSLKVSNQFNQIKDRIKYLHGDDDE